MVFGRKRSQHKKNTLKEIPNINPKYIKLFFFFLSQYFFAFFSPSFFFKNFYLCKQRTWTRCISQLYIGERELKKYAIAQQMQMFKKEMQRELWEWNKQQTELQTVKEKQTKQPEEKNTKDLKSTNRFLSWMGVALRPEVKVTAAGGLPRGGSSPNSK